MHPRRAFLVSACLALALAILPLSSLADDELESLRERLNSLEERLSDDGGINIGGALRTTYSYRDWDEGNKNRGGDFAFDTFRLNLSGELRGLLFSAEYRFYPQFDFHTPHHGWIGYQFTEQWQGRIGIHQVPFGLLPYASHNFWFSGAYYVGLEDDYDLGLKALYESGPWNLALAFYKNEELGDAGNASRYSVDVISNADGGFAGAQPAGNRETNQFNARLAYTFDHGAPGSTELGASGQFGGLYNENTGSTGDHWAAALHLNGNYGRWNVQLQWARYEYNPKNPAEVEGIPMDNDVITMGAYASSWGVPAKADIGIANVAYTLPVDRGPIDSLTFYSDNTVIQPYLSRFNTIWQNVIGCMVAAGPVFTYFDIISGKNMIFSGGSMVGDENEGRTTRVNVNFGYYF